MARFEFHSGIWPGINLVLLNYGLFVNLPAPKCAQNAPLATVPDSYKCRGHKGQVINTFDERQTQKN